MTVKGGIISLFVILLLVGSVFAPIALGKQNFIEKIKSNDSNLFDSQYFLIEASNSFDYGLKVGRIVPLILIIIIIVKFFTRFFIKDKTLSITKSELLISTDKEYSILSERCPFFLEELNGLSQSLKMETQDLLYYLQLASPIFNRIKEDCTGTLATGLATKNDDTFLTQNFDQSVDNSLNRLFFFFFRIISTKPWIAKIDSFNYQYVFFGIPIVFEIPVMNEKGLGWGAMATRLTNNLSRDIDQGDGISTYMLERLSLMTCKNVFEVEILWQSMERSFGRNEKWPHHWDNSNPIWCDRDGNIMMIEQSHNYFISVFGDSTDITNGSQDILWHANHHQWLDPYLTGSATPEEYPSSALRENRAHDILEQFYGQIDLDVCKKIIRDYEGGTDKTIRDSSDICRYADKNNSIYTVLSWIVQPKNFTIYWTRGTPDRYGFKKNDFSKLFKEKTISCQTSSKIWKCKSKELFMGNWLRFVSDSYLLENNTYEKLLNFFKDCKTPKDFYLRIQEKVYDAGVDPLHQKSDLKSYIKKLPEIVDCVQKPNACLYSFQQCILFVGGVKAVYSDFDSENEVFKLKNECGDFKIEMWRSLCFIPPVLFYRSHSQVVIDMWNGSDEFVLYGKNINKLEVDPWQNEFSEFLKYNDCIVFNPLYPAKKNSILHTN